MRTLFAIFDQQISIFIKHTDTILKSHNLKIGLVYRAFESTDFKRSWSRHLDDYFHSMFCRVNDPIELNIFNPYKKIIKLNDLSGSYIAHNIINSFASQRQEYFDETVFCCYIYGLDETFVMAPKASSDALSIVLAMKKLDDEKARDDLAAREDKKIRNKKARERSLKKNAQGEIF